MTTLSTDRARQLLGGGGLNGHDVVAGHANRNGLTLVTKRPRRGWSWFQRDQRPREPKAPARRDGSRLIALSAGLLFLLGVGLLAVSIAAQYAYFLRERHQHVASLIEAAALDVGLLIFSLLALGVARKGLPARAERVLIVACAAASAFMNYANADPHSWRSVAAWTMPPIFLAVVADRVIAITRRHFLGMAEGRSAWRDGLGWTATAAKVTGLGVLYVLRVPLAPVSTSKGLRLAVLNATPLPQAPERPAIEAPRKSAPEPAVIDGKSADCECPAPYSPGGPVPCVAAGRCMRPPQQRCAVDLRPYGRPCLNPQPCPDHPDGRPVLPKVTPAQRRILAGSPGGLTKTERLLTLVKKRHGNLIEIPLDQVSRIATAIAPEVDMHPASARNALLAAVRASRPGREGDRK